MEGLDCDVEEFGKGCKESSFFLQEGRRSAAGDRYLGEGFEVSIKEFYLTNYPGGLL